MNKRNSSRLPDYPIPLDWVISRRPLDVDCMFVRIQLARLLAMSSRRLMLLLASSFWLWPAGMQAEPPGAFALLEQIRQKYATLEAYSDLGEIERTFGDDDADSTLHFFETTTRADGGFLWRTHGETTDGFEERVIWRTGADAYVYSSLLGQYKPISSLLAELAHGFGDGSYEALLVPLLLAGDSDGLSAPEGAVVEGPEPCGESDCWILSMTRMGGTIESVLRVDRADLLIREVEVRLTDSATVFSRALAGAGIVETPAAEDGGKLLKITVKHHPAVAPPTTFKPPESARRVAEWEPTSDAASQPEEPWLELGFQEEITVSLFSVVARIVDSRGAPLLGLEPSDLIAQVGDQEVPVLSLDWSSSYSPGADIPPIELAEARALAREGRLSVGSSEAPVSGRLVVMFLQIDLEPSRIAGHLKILPDIKELLESLHPNDRVAIVSFDSHLKLWWDFSRDRAATLATLKEAIGYGMPSARRSQEVSLLATFDVRAAKDAASPEKALQLTAEALAPLPGEKELIYLGWGLGRYGAGGVRMTPDYEPAVRALDAANATVFVLDVSQADRHSLEIGLQSVAAHTGGTYARTFHFASQAVHRLAQTLMGHYVVNIDRSALPKARGRLTLRLRAKTGNVLFKPLTLG